MRRIGFCSVALGCLVLAATLYAPPLRAPPRPAPHFVPRPEPRSFPYEAPKRPYERDRPKTSDPGSRSHPAQGPFDEIQRFEFIAPVAGTAKDQDDSQPYVYCALPRDNAFLNTFGERFTAAKEKEISTFEATARGILAVGTRISNDFRRDDLLSHVAAHSGKRPFILVCHTEGSNYNRNIPLGDGPDAGIKEDELRAICAKNDTELFLVSCHSADLNISEEISYGDAFRIVKVVMDSWKSSGKMSVAELKALFVETAHRELSPGNALRISFGADVKKVVIVTAPRVSSNGRDAEQDDGFSWIKTLLAILIAIPIIGWIYRSNGPLLTLVIFLGAVFFYSFYVRWGLFDSVVVELIAISVIGWIYPHFENYCFREDNIFQAFSDNPFLCILGIIALVFLAGFVFHWLLDPVEQ